jgi:hypothetical protein
MYCRINILRGNVQAVQNMRLASMVKCNRINILRRNVQDIKNIGVGARRKYYGLNTLQAKY